MKIIFASSVCSMDEYYYLQSIKSKDKFNASQKYYDMLIHGFDDDCDVCLDCVSVRMIDKSNCLERILPRKNEIISKKLRYLYTRVINSSKIHRKLYNILESIRITNKIIKESNQECFIVCDILAWDVAVGALIAGKLHGIKTCGFITDLPGYLADIGISNKNLLLKVIYKIINNISLFCLKFYDSYCYITETIDSIVNKNHKPYEIIEGMVYKNDWQRMVNNHVDKNVVLYAGGLYEKFGIKNLVVASSKIKDIENFELHLYGEGDCVDFIREINKIHPNIIYKGIVSLEEITNAEKNAKLLINPRPTRDLYTKYSFPSKTIEYMSAGRPVLTTKLEGIPQEYSKYLFYFKDCDVDSLVKDIKHYISYDNIILDEKGLKNYEYVHNFKNNTIQAKKLKKMLLTL